MYLKLKIFFDHINFFLVGKTDGSEHFTARITLEKSSSWLCLKQGVFMNDVTQVGGRGVSDFVTLDIGL